MITELTEKVLDIVTGRSKLTIAVMLILTVVMLVGAGGIAEPANSELGDDSREQEKLEYISTAYSVGQLPRGQAPWHPP